MATQKLVSDSGWKDVPDALLSHQERELVWVGTVPYSAGAPTGGRTVVLASPPDFTASNPFNVNMVQNIELTGVINAAGQAIATPLMSGNIGSSITYVPGDLNVTASSGTMGVTMTNPITFSGFTITSLTYVARVTLWDQYALA